MNILFVTTTLPRFDGDSQSPFVFEQARAWAMSRSHDTVYILAPDDVTAKKEETVGNVNVHRYQYFWPRSLQKLAYPALMPNIQRNPLLIVQLPLLMTSLYFSIKQMIKQYQIDLVYAHWVVPNGLVVWLENRASRIAHHDSPFVVQNHSSDLRILVNIPFVGKSIARSIIRNAQVFFCVNKQLKEEALSLFGGKERLNIEKKIVVLPMGANTESRIAYHASRVKTKYDVGFIGRLTKKKGVDKLLEAVNLLAKDKLVSMGIAGTGEEEPALRLVTNTRKLKTEFLGQVGGERKERFFKETKILAFPSIPTHGDTEGIPVAMLEALVRGKIIIASTATNIELLPEWDQIKRAVILISDPHDIKELAGALKSVLEWSPSEISKRTQGLKEIMARYEWKNLIKEYILNFEF